MMFALEIYAAIAFGIVIGFLVAALLQTGRERLNEIEGD
jgi:hypothetical protein